MNILMICDEYPPGRHGGIGSVVQQLARTFVTMGHNVVVAGFCFIGYGGEDEFDDQGVKVYRYRLKMASPFFENQDALHVRIVMRLLKMTGILSRDVENSLKEYGVFLREIIERHNVDVIEMPDYHDSLRFLKHKVHFPIPDVPLVIKMNGSMTYFNAEAGKPTPPHIRQMEKEIIESADAVVAVSKYTATKSRQYFEYKKQIGVLHNGINVPASVLNIDKKKGLVVFTGTLVEKKGIYQLMKSWNLVHERRPDAVLQIYGKGPVEQIRKELSASAANSVVFMGHATREELYRVLTSAEVAVFPSYAECFAMAPMEAMACETAVVYSTRTSGPELITDGVDGLLADPDDVDELAGKILLLLDNEELSRKIAHAGRLRVLENFDIKIIAQQNIQLFNEVLNAGKK